MLASARSRQYAALIFMAFLNGWFVSCVGPLIPHFAKATNTEETDYAYLFMVRSIANVLGGILVKYLLNQLKVTPLMYIYLSVVVACLFISTLSLSTLNISITLFASSICLVGTAVITFGVTIKLFVTDRPDYFIQLIGFFFGVGAMCGPLFVYLFELENFKVLGLAHLTIILCFIKYPLPDLNSQQSQLEANGPKLSKKSVLCICMIFFFYATIELGMGSWISTYSIKSGVADVKNSAIYSLLFWLPNCLSRIGWMYVPGSVQHRLGLGLKAVLVTSLLTLIFQYFSLYLWVCIFAPITAGIFIGGVFGFCIALPVDSGFIPRSQDNADFILANSLGEGLLIMPLGYSMSLFGFKAMMIEVFLISIVCYGFYTETVKSMIANKEQYSSGLLKEIV